MKSRIKPTMVWWLIRIMIACRLLRWTRRLADRCWIETREPGLEWEVAVTKEMQCAVRKGLWYS